MIPDANIAERKRLWAHLRVLDHADQILFIMACLGTDGMRKMNDFADRLVAGSAQDVARAAQRVVDAAAGVEPPRYSAAEISEAIAALRHYAGTGRCDANIMGAIEIVASIAEAKGRRRWLITYRHASRDVMHDKGPLGECEEFAITITDRHPVIWLRDAVLRNLEPLSPDLHVDRRTRILAILSAIEITADVSDDDVAELENHL